MALARAGVALNRRCQCLYIMILAVAAAAAGRRRRAWRPAAGGRAGYLPFGSSTLPYRRLTGNLAACQVGPAVTGRRPAARVTDDRTDKRTMDGTKEGWDDLKATWQEARRCRQVATSMLEDGEVLARVDRPMVQDTVRIASLNAEEMRHGGAGWSVADSSDLSDWYPTIAMAMRKLVVGFDHDVSRVLMDSSELVGESDVENWPVWRCKVQKPGLFMK